MVSGLAATEAVAPFTRRPLLPKAPPPKKSRSLIQRAHAGETGAGGAARTKTRKGNLRMRNMSLLNTA